MIVYYVWTDIQLLNALNAKINIHSGKSAALMVLMLKRVTPDLVDRIEALGEFVKVIRIQPPTDFGEMPRWKRRIRLFFYGNEYRSYFAKQIPRDNCSLFVTSGYWSYALFVLEALYKHNPGLSVMLLDEGIGSYYRTLARACQIWPRSCIEERLTRWMYFGKFGKKAVHLVNGIMAYHPERVRLECRQKITLPPLSQNIEMFRPLLELWRQRDEHMTAEAFLFSMPGLSAEDSAAEEKVWERLQEHCPESLRLIHPDMQDDFVGPFEAICARRDLSDCLLLGFCSTSMLYPQYFFTQEPYVMFLHNLMGAESGLSVREAQAYMDDLIASYSEPEKIMAPYSIAELDDMLAKLKLMWGKNK